MAHNYFSNAVLNLNVQLFRKHDDYENTIKYTERNHCTLGWIKPTGLRAANSQ